MDVKATQKFVLTSPRKLREVVGVIKKLKPTEAYEKLPYVKKRAAELLRKVIGTAIANARQANLNEADLIFKEIQIGEGPRLKRWRAGARGRAKPYKKRMSHIRVVLTTEKKPAITETQRSPQRTQKNKKIAITKAQKSPRKTLNKNKSNAGKKKGTGK